MHANNYLLGNPYRVPFVEPATRLIFQFFKPFQQAVSLHWACFAEFGNFTPIGRAVSFQVLEYHLLLLEQFKPTLVDAGGC